MISIRESFFDYLGWIPSDNRVRRHIFGNHRMGKQGRPIPHRYSGYYGYAKADPDIGTYFNISLCGWEFRPGRAPGKFIIIRKGKVETQSKG